MAAAEPASLFMISEAAPWPRLVRFWNHLHLDPHFGDLTSVEKTSSRCKSHLHIHIYVSVVIQTFCF